jgi:hypothetical protein
MSPACPSLRRSIDAHFAGRIGPAEAQRMFEHLAACSGCRRYFERHQLLAALDPRAPTVEDRLARGLGIGPRPRPRWSLWAPLSVALAAACLLVLLRPVKSGEPVPRGGPLASDLIAVRVPKGSARERLPKSGRLAPTDELAFAYVNPEKYERLMVFATDERGRVYWYYPAWTDPAANPVAIEIRPGDRPSELGEAVAHAFQGRSLTLYGLFLHDAPTVRQIEAQIGRGTLSSRNGRIVTYHLDVGP